MSTTITDVDELQDMSSDLTEDYVLGNNIDASATSGWNGGEGFDPIGNAYTTPYFAEVTHNDDSKYANGMILEDLDLSLYATSTNGLRKYSADDLSMSYQNTSYPSIWAWGDDDYVYTADGWATIGTVRKYQKADLALTASSVYTPGTSPFGLWGDDTYIYETNTGAPEHIIRFRKSDLVKIDTLNVGCTGGIWGDDDYLYVVSSSTLSKISLSSFTVVDSVSLTPSGDGYSICGSTNYLYVGIRSGASSGYVSKYWKSLQYVTSSSVFLCSSSGNVHVSLAGTDYIIGSGNKVLRLYNEDDLSYIGSGTVFNYVSSLCSNSVYNNDYAYVGSGWETGIYKYHVITPETRFTGTLDGQGYTISDLYIDRSTEDYVGLFGYTNGATVQNVGLTDVDITGDDYIAALIGYSVGDTVSQGYITGSVEGGDDYVGALMGYVSGSDIDDCYNRANVTGDRYIAGLIGRLNTGTVDNSFSTGLITGNTDVGGLIGASGGTVTNSFWDTTTSGQASSDGGTGKTTAQMLAFATFYDVWDIGQTDTDRNNGYPFLSWEIDETATTWLIYGEGTYPSPWDFPDLLDDKGRPVKNAVVDAIRTDVHSEPYIVETQRTDANGTCSFSLLPVGQDIVFHATWGGITNDENEEWFPIRVNEIEDGGTGSGTATGALDNLGVHGVAMMWEFVLGD